MSPIDQSTIRVETRTPKMGRMAGKSVKTIVAEGDEDHPGTYEHENNSRIGFTGRTKKLVDVPVDNEGNVIESQPTERQNEIIGLWRKISSGKER